MAGPRKTALITGAGKNIGRACAHALAEEGFNVAINGSSDRAACERVAKECEKLGAKAIVVLGHSNCGAIKGAVDKVKLGNITALLKNFEPALKAVGKSVGNKFRGMNDFAPCQIPTPAQCIGNADCWLHDAWGNGMAPASHRTSTAPLSPQTDRHTVWPVSSRSCSRCLLAMANGSRRPKRN